MDLGDIDNVFFFFRHTAGYEIIPVFSNFKCYFPYGIHKSIQTLSILQRSW